MNNIIAIVVFAIPLISLVMIIVGTNKYKNIQIKDTSGCEIARKILDKNNLKDTFIVEIKNSALSNYDYNRDTLKLSSKTFHDESILACSIGAYEAATASLYIQKDIIILMKRLCQPAIRIINYLGYLVILYSIIMQEVQSFNIGIAILMLCLLFYFITYLAEIKIMKKAKSEMKKLKLYSKYENEYNKLLEIRTLCPIASIIFNLLDLTNKISIGRNS